MMGKTKHKKHHRHDGEEAGNDDEGTSSNDGIKLILKVGSKSHDKHKKKKKKKDKKKERDKERKHRHHHKESRQFGDGEGAGEDVPMDMGVADGGDQPQVKAEPIVDEVKGPREALPHLLEYILTHLQKKDTNGFFANPVDDQFAPGYSTIIHQPMDFSTMKAKLPTYPNLMAFRADFELVCNNAMTYNTADTIYNKTAKKMLHYGQKLFSAEKVRSMRNNLPHGKLIPENMLGLDPIRAEDGSEVDDDDDDDVSKVIEDIREVVRRPPGRFEAVPDDLTSAEILEQARTAARGASNRLRIHKPKSRMGFLRQAADGSTSLKFLTGSAGVVPGTENDRPVLLGSLIGKVKQGSGSMQGFREDRRNLAKAVHPLYYGAYSSHGPSYDSTFANLTKDETELVYSTYGDQVGVDYAESIMNFSRNCNYAMTLVDNLLDILTSYEHRKTSKYVEERKMLRREDEMLDGVFRDDGDEHDPPAEQGTAKVEPKTEIDFNALRSLKDDGIDMDFLDGLQKQYEVQPESEKTDLLRTNVQLIEELKNVQNERLSAALPVHYSHLPKPNDKEMELANTIQSNLLEITGNMRPGQVADPEAIRRLLGAPPVPIKTENDNAAVAMQVD